MGTHDVASPRPRVCTPRILPRDLARPHVARLGASGRMQAVAPVAKQWAPDAVLSVAFIGGSAADRERVRAVAAQWEQRCGIKFEWRSSLPAMIRIAFDPNDGAWSYLGTDCAEIPANQPTMNLGWVDQDVILHEFGHALSLAHEHQNPQGGIKWNEATVIADLSGPPNYWDEATIRHNVLEKYALDQVHATEFDPQSIMLYSFPASWTLDGFSAPWNQTISAKDAELASRFYPKAPAPPVARRNLPLRLAIGGAISQQGEIDEYEFVAPVLGDYVIETTGTIDLLLAIYRSDGSLLRQDDDSGRGNNARLEVGLVPGTYRVTVRPYGTAQGKYRVVAWA